MARLCMCVCSCVRVCMCMCVRMCECECKCMCRQRVRELVRVREHEREHVHVLVCACAQEKDDMRTYCQISRTCPFRPQQHIGAFQTRMSRRRQPFWETKVTPSIRKKSYAYATCIAHAHLASISQGLTRFINITKNCTQGLTYTHMPPTNAVAPPFSNPTISSGQPSIYSYQHTHNDTYKHTTHTRTQSQKTHRHTHMHTHTHRHGHVRGGAIFKSHNEQRICVQIGICSPVLVQSTIHRSHRQATEELQHLQVKKIRIN